MSNRPIRRPLAGRVIIARCHPLRMATRPAAAAAGRAVLRRPRLGRADPAAGRQPRTSTSRSPSTATTTAPRRARCAVSSATASARRTSGRTRRRSPDAAHLPGPADRPPRPPLSRRLLRERPCASPSSAASGTVATDAFQRVDSRRTSALGSAARAGSSHGCRASATNGGVGTVRSIFATAASATWCSPAASCSPTATSTRAVDDYCALVGLPPGLIENVTDGTNALLVAIDADGRLLATEEAIVDAARPNRIARSS